MVGNVKYQVVIGKLHGCDLQAMWPVHQVIIDKRCESMPTLRNITE